MRIPRTLIALILAAACHEGFIAPPAFAGWWIAGTAVGPDETTGVPGVRVTLFPSEIASTTDEYGNFLVAWDGKRGYLTVQAPGADLCKRLALWEKPTAEADSTLDLGQIVVSPTHRFSGRGRPLAPRGTVPPDSLDLPGPQPGTPERYWMVFRVVTDLYGTPTTVDRYEGEDGPAELQAHLIAWLRGIHWTVNRETLCGLEDPFRTMFPMTYWWRDGRWIFLPDGGPTKAQKQVLEKAGRQLNIEGLSAPVDSTQIPK